MKTALITGASGGIGIELVKKFCENGYFTIAQYNTNVKPIENLAKSLPEEFSRMIFPVQADLSKDEGVKKLTDFIDGNFKSLTVLVNNAGVSLYKQIQDVSDEEISTLMQINFNSAYKLCRYAVGKMTERQYGKIVNVSSVWGERGASMETLYSASKSALIGLTKALAKEVAPSNVAVNCVCPGVIDTKMNDIFSEEEKQEIISSIPQNRMGSAKEVASLVYFLTQEESQYITGQSVVIDGGYTL